MYWRYRFIFIFFSVLFLFVTMRLFYWQVVRAVELSALGESQYGTNIVLSPKRGEIRTSDGFPIASNRVTYLVFANPQEVLDKDKTATLLSPLIDRETASISALLSLNRYWIALSPKINPTQKADVEKLNLKGVGFDDRTIRFYPEASIGAKLLGFVGKDDLGNDKGYFGLEGFYDRQLRGKEGIATQIHDAFGRPILAKLNAGTGEVNGRNLNLHIDRVLQYVMDDELKTAMEEYGAKGAMAAMMDPKTGAVLAITAYPSFDPTNFYEYSDSEFKNPFISDTYEPGSTFKPLVMAAAINEGLVKADTRCTTCDGPVKIGEYSIKTWNDTYKPNLTMTEVIEHSDNTGMVFTAQKLGLNRMIDYIKKFGFEEPTGIDLQGEVTPFLRPHNSWYPIDLATSSFGQGISVTPIQLLSSFAVLANGGVRMQPQVVASVETPDGNVIKIDPKVVAKPISEKTAKIMTEILVQTVDKGEAAFAKPRGYRIAGKTGTAQIPIAGHYDPSLTIASFIGYAPADDPKFIMLVIVDRPTKSIYGAETAAPIFFRIAKKALMYFGVPPTETVTSK